MSVLEKDQTFIKGALAGLIAGVVMFVFVEIFHITSFPKRSNHKTPAAKDAPGFYSILRR